MGLKAAIFDLDGTLIDSMWTWERLMLDFLDKYGCKYDIKITEDLAYMTFEQSSKYIKEKYSLNQSPDAIIEEWTAISVNYYKNIIELKGGAKEYLEKLRSDGVKIGLATACPRVLCELVLNSRGIKDLIDVFVYAEDVGKSKDKPDVYIETMRQLDVTVDECMLYEDILTALRTAHGIGMKVTVIEDESSKADREALMAEADRYIVDFKELL